MDNLAQTGFWQKLLGLPVVASEHGQHVDALIIYIHWLMIALFVGWMSYFVYVLLRFRRSRHPKADYTGAQTHASSYVEGAVALIEGVLLVGVAVPFWARLVQTFPPEKDSVVIKVVAQQFAWNFRYPGPDGQFGRQDMKLVTAENPFGVDKTDPAGRDDFQTLNEIHVPLNKPVILQISSKDVVHSFKVIALRVAQDAIPGMVIPTHFVANKPGKYQINCAQLCGNGHAAMSQGYLVVESPEKYQAWLKSKTHGTSTVSG